MDTVPVVARCRKHAIVHRVVESVPDRPRRARVDEAAVSNLQVDLSESLGMPVVDVEISDCVRILAQEGSHAGASFNLVHVARPFD